MDGFLCKQTVNKIKQILESPVHRETLVRKNYEVASRHYSYAVLRNRLGAVMNDFFETSQQQIPVSISDPQQVVFLGNDISRTQ